MPVLINVSGTQLNVYLQVTIAFLNIDIQFHIQLNKQMLS